MSATTDSSGIRRNTQGRLFDEDMLLPAGYDSHSSGVTCLSPEKSDGITVSNDIGIGMASMKINHAPLLRTEQGSTFSGVKILSPEPSLSLILPFT